MTVDAQVRKALPDAVKPRDIKEWISWHRNVKQSIEGYFDIANENGNPSIKKYNITTSNIQILLREAVKKGVSVRPFGGTWSFSDIASSPHWMVDTAYLNWFFPMNDNLLEGAYTNRTNELFFIQGGIHISQINRVIEKNFGRSLSTSGASNGQTIAGAMSTGTHGSAIDQGGIHNHIVGIHLITGPDSHVWLERETDPATGKNFAQLLNAELIQNDDLFNAALVSFGAMGFIAGVMVKTVPIFRLRQNRDWMDFDDALRKPIKTLDFSDITLPRTLPGTRPYFFMVVLNPFDQQSNASVTVMTREDYHGEEIDYAKHSTTGPGYELLGAVGAITDVFGASIPNLVRIMGEQHLKPRNNKVGTLGETFDFTTPRTDAAGAALGLSHADILRAIDLLIDEQRREAAPLVFATRFVKHSGATLEFTKYDNTVVLDIDGVYSDRTLDFLDRAYARLEKENVAYTQHWGKLNNYNARNIRARFGHDRVNSFLKARQKLLNSKKVRALFATPFLERVGLAN